MHILMDSVDLMEGLEAQREMMEDDMSNASTRSRAESVVVQVCCVDVGE